MDIQLKGIKIGRLMIADSDSIKIKLEPKEVYDLFIKAVKEGKIEFTSSNSDYEATPKVCPECKSDLILEEVSSGGDDLLYCSRCDWVEEFGKPIS